MNNQPPSQLPSGDLPAGAATADDRLERYLDGLMSPDEQAAFETQSAAQPAVAAQIAAHRRLTAVLGQMYDTSSLPATHAKTAPPPPAPLPMRAFTPRRLIRLAAIAAAIALPVAAAVWYLAPSGHPQEFKPLTTAEYQQRNRDAMVAEYKSQVASGFKPTEVCTTDEQFAQWTTTAFGHGLKPTHPGPGGAADGPAEPVFAGWSKGKVFSAYSGLLLAHVDGKPVMVVMDHAPVDRMIPKDDATSNPRIFSRKVNGVWMVEVTPLDQPRVITRIEAAP